MFKYALFRRHFCDMRPLNNVKKLTKQKRETLKLCQASKNQKKIEDFKPKKNRET